MTVESLALRERTAASASVEESGVGVVGLDERRWWGDGIEQFQSFLELAERAEKANVVEKIDGVGIQGDGGGGEAPGETRKNTAD